MDPEKKELSDENQSDNQEAGDESGDVGNPANNELLQLKKDFAKEYFEKIYLDNGGLPGFLLSETGTVEDYMTSEGIMDKVKDKVILRMLLEKVLEKETVDKLDDMKNKIEIVSTKEGLEELKKNVGISSSVTNQVANNTSQQSAENDVVMTQEEQQVDQYIKDVSADTEKYSGKREKLTAVLGKIVEYDKANPVKYNRGKIASLKEGLDCSGLVIYALHQIGLKEIGYNSRDMFLKLEKTQKITQESNGSISDNVNIKQGDLLFRDSKNPKQKLNGGKIPPIKKDGENYSIHHVAFVESVDKSSGKITIVESNGSNGIVKRVISPEEEKNRKHQSDLYVGSVNYDTLLAYKGKNENIDNVA